MGPGGKPTYIGIYKIEITTEDVTHIFQQVIQAPLIEKRTIASVKLRGELNLERLWLLVI